MAPLSDRHLKDMVEMYAIANKYQYGIVPDISMHDEHGRLGTAAWSIQQTNDFGTMWGSEDLHAIGRGMRGEFEERFFRIQDNLSTSTRYNEFEAARYELLDKFNGRKLLSDDFPRTPLHFDLEDAINSRQITEVFFERYKSNLDIDAAYGETAAFINLQEIKHKYENRGIESLSLSEKQILGLTVYDITIFNRVTAEREEKHGSVDGPEKKVFDVDGSGPDFEGSPAHTPRGFAISRDIDANVSRDLIESALVNGFTRDEIVRGVDSGSDLNGPEISSATSAADRVSVAARSAAASVAESYFGTAYLDDGFRGIGGAAVPQGTSPEPRGGPNNNPGNSTNGSGERGDTNPGYEGGGTRGGGSSGSVGGSSNQTGGNEGATRGGDYGDGTRGGNSGGGSFGCFSLTTKTSTS